MMMKLIYPISKTRRYAKPRNGLAAEREYHKADMYMSDVTRNDVKEVSDAEYVVLCMLDAAERDHRGEAVLHGVGETYMHVAGYRVYLIYDIKEFENGQRENTTGA